MRQRDQEIYLRCRPSYEEVMNILKSDLTALAGALKEKKIKPSEVCQAYLSQINKYNPNINAMVTINEQALAEAEKLDFRQATDEDIGPLGGLPLGIKDLLCTRGLKTTAGSKILKDFVPPYSATLVDRLSKAGAIILGKTNLDEFAMGSSNETSAFGVCKNPWNQKMVPGGSSGGSAAAVAAGMVAAAIGTDTGGSIRQPASFCHIVGVKPTYGRVSRYGLIAFASSLDQAGPMTRSVRDSALLLEIICGHDSMDATSAKIPVPLFSKALTTNIEGKTVGVAKEFLTAQLHPEVRKVFEYTLDILRQAGAQIKEFSLPLTHMAVPIYYLVATSEASSNLSRYDGVRFGGRADFSKRTASDLEDFYSRTRAEGFGDEVKRRIILGTYALSSGYYDAYYKKACQVRRLLRQQYLDAFKSCDVIVGPVSTTPAFQLGEKIDDPLAMYMNDVFTTSANLAGLPGMSVPAGFSDSGLPIGVQVLANHFDEQTMLDIGAAIEMGVSLSERFPDVI